MSYQDSSFVSGSGVGNQKGTTAKTLARLKTKQGTALIAFLIGIFIGLVILGWGPLRVNYTDTTPASLREDLRADYARMIVDSYSYAHIANPQFAEQMALARLKELGESSALELQKIVQDPQIQNMNDILNLQQLHANSTQTTLDNQNTIVGDPTSNQDQNGSSTLMKSLGLALLAILLFAIAFYAIFLFIKQSRANTSTAPKVPRYRDTNKVNEFTKTDYRSDQNGWTNPDLHFFTTYKIGNDLYEKRETINSHANNDYLGECGVEVIDFIGVGTPKRASAFEIYVFDKMQPSTSSKILLCEHAYSDKNVYERLKHKGEFVLLEPEKDIILETDNLQVIVRIKEMHYGNAPLPENSYVEQITFEFSVWEKSRLAS